MVERRLIFQARRVVAYAVIDRQIVVDYPIILYEKSIAGERKISGDRIAVGTCEREIILIAIDAPRLKIGNAGIGISAIGVLQEKIKGIVFLVINTEGDSVIANEIVAFQEAYGRIAFQYIRLPGALSAKHHLIHAIVNAHSNLWRETRVLRHAGIIIARQAELGGERIGPIAVKLSGQVFVKHTVKIPMVGRGNRVVAYVWGALSLTWRTAVSDRGAMLITNVPVDFSNELFIRGAQLSQI